MPTNFKILTIYIDSIFSNKHPQVLLNFGTTLKRKRLYFSSLEGVLILGVCYLKDGSYFGVGAD